MLNSTEPKSTYPRCVDVGEGLREMSSGNFGSVASI